MPTRRPPHAPNLEIRWKMFHGFKDTKWLEIRPLTIFIGANGTGKSSLVAPLLLLKQTLQSSDTLSNLVTKEKLIDVGKFTELVFQHNSLAKIFFGLRFHTHDPERSIKPVGSYAPGALELELAGGKSPREVILTSYTILDTYKRLFLKRKRFASGNYSLSGNLFKKLRPNERKALLESSPVNFMFSPSRALSSLYYSMRETHRSSLKQPSVAFQEYLNVVGFVYDQVGSLLRELAYIGPIRDRPKRYYERSADIPITVGAAGEVAPQLFRERYASLHKKLDKWARAFGLASHISCNDISDDMFEIQLISRKPQLRTNISDSGFGASQLFPLIIQAITARPKSLTIAEQPEIHLNPRCQSVLADLFVEMATSGRKAIVETHSEHLLLRLRRLVASGAIKPSQIALYFFEKQDGRTEVREVPISPNGHIESSNWPKGFFEDALRESLALASAQS